MQASGQNNLISPGQGQKSASPDAEEALHDKSHLAPEPAKAADAPRSPTSSPKVGSHELPTGTSEHDAANAPPKPMYRPRAPIKKPITSGKPKGA
ncbi:hypothetical protein GLOTRDRAFT_112222 [Gloeophyllum trabeum ATCC 11539]|uniref:Uncharacterized protein n=1 Tax=Gloeophyllum trabeum (strain ATCC 11539 / FP-39264 / Madison 617) TaxID=670483 RepID=S7RDF6_GLOTA|nr:uncharacterized protein GLOTRDRAFT_112222 [Gloeophyllum trabeum ATCC 11539]EPQ52250.1 hypothetical protein GLOTRDRAFT_112222 [Gloeophyllum trabeum ATCC 11539]